MFLVVCQLSRDVLALKTHNVIGAFDPSIVTVKQSNCKLSSPSFSRSSFT